MMKKTYISKIILLLPALMGLQVSLFAQNGAEGTSAASAKGPDTMLVIIAGLLLLVSLGLAIMLMHLKKISGKTGTKLQVKSALMLATLLGLHLFVQAQDAGGTAAGTARASSGMDTMMLIIIGLLLLLSLGLSLMVLRLTNLLKQQHKPAGATETKGALSSWWADLDKKFFTKAVPVEKEADVLLDHDYDGIKELDNALPPWWKWGFYITVILAVIYMFRFHMGGNGPSPEEEYNREMKLAAVQLEEYRKKAGDQVDEKSVTMADKAGITAGGELYKKTCTPCHGTDASGMMGPGIPGAGPNLTDEYWLHGGSIGEVFKTIKEGVQQKGMQAWKSVYSPAEIKNISSYILSLQGTKPAAKGGKAPDGTLYVPAAKPDSVGVKKDTAGAKPSPAAADAKPAK